MKFYQLQKGQAFYFAENHMPERLVKAYGVDCAGVGRYVSSYSDVHDPEEWIACNRNAEVVPE